MKHTHWFLSLVLVGLAAFPACSSSNSAAKDAGTGGAGTGGTGGTGGGTDASGTDVSGTDASATDTGGADAMVVKSNTAPYPTIGSIDRLDPELDMVIAPTAKIDVLADGFVWSEGPLWVPSKSFLLFTDVPKDTIYKWQEGMGVSVWLSPAGCLSAGCKTLPEPGANGLTLDKDGGLLMCQHGERRVAKLASIDTPNAAQMVVVDKYMGKPFNSPNDLIVHKGGSIFFTDPPYGSMTQTHTDPALVPPAGIGFLGVYRWDPATTMLSVIDETVKRPNGIAFSPDQTKLYVASSDDVEPIWMEYILNPTTLAVVSKKIFFDARTLPVATPPRVGGNDGIAVDAKGYIFATGPGGVLIFNPAGKHLGTILTTERTSNNKFGGADGKTLFMTADRYLLRIQTLNPVAPPPP